MPFDFNDVFMAKWHSCTTADEMYDLLSTIGPYEKVIDEVAEMYATSKAEIGSKSRPLKALVRERKRQLLHYTYNAERKLAVFEKRPEASFLYLMIFPPEAFTAEISKLPGVKEIKREQEGDQVFVYVVLPKLPIVEASPQDHKQLIDTTTFVFRKLIASKYHAALVLHEPSAPPP